MKNFISLLLMVLMMSCAAKTPITSEKDKEIAIATLQQGIEFYNSGKYILSLKKLLEAEKTIPHNAKLHNTLGLVYLAKERYPQAVTHLEMALEFNPDFIEAKNNLGAAYLKSKEWDKAIKLFKEVLGNLLYETPEIAYTNLGWAYYYQNMHKSSKSYFKKALDIRPNYLVAVHGLALTYIKTGYEYQAVDFLHRYLKKSPDASILHSDLARAYESLGKYDLAKRSWMLVIHLEPESSALAREAEKRLLELR